MIILPFFRFVSVCHAGVWDRVYVPDSYIGSSVRWSSDLWRWIYPGSDWTMAVILDKGLLYLPSVHSCSFVFF